MDALQRVPTEEGLRKVGYGNAESEALVPKARGTREHTVGGGYVEAL